MFLDRTGALLTAFPHALTGRKDYDFNGGIERVWVPDRPYI